MRREDNRLWRAGAVLLLLLTIAADLALIAVAAHFVLKFW